MSKSEMNTTRNKYKIKPYFKIHLKKNLFYSPKSRNIENLSQINTMSNKTTSNFSPFHFRPLSQVPNFKIYECPLEMNCPYYKKLTNLENELNKILKSNIQLSRLSGLYLNSLKQKDKLYKSMIIENKKLKSNFFEQIEKLKSSLSLTEENNQQESLISIKKKRNSLFDLDEEINNNNNNEINYKKINENKEDNNYNKENNRGSKIFITSPSKKTEGSIRRIIENKVISDGNTEKDINSLTIELDKEKEIENKVNEYKNELHNNFLKILEDGKIADDKRNQEIENETDPEKKKKLQQENMQEKLLLAKKLKQVKEDMEIKISSYEKQLKENNN